MKKLPKRLRLISNKSVEEINQMYEEWCEWVKGKGRKDSHIESELIANLLNTWPRV